MKNKIVLLIIASAVGLIALSGVQAYLVNNSYILKRDAFINDTKQKIGRIDDSSEELDLIYEEVGDYLIELLVQYKLDEVNKSDVMNLFQVRIDSFNADYVDIYQNDLSKLSLPYDISFHKRLNSIVLFDSLGMDTIFSNSGGTGFHFLGDDFDEKDGHLISQAYSTTDHTTGRIKGGVKSEIAFELKTHMQDRMNIQDWKKIIFGQMSVLLILSVLIFLFVIGLLCYSIKSLISQKKIADVRTDFVNNITHELKTPLATLTLATKMLKKQDVLQNTTMADSTISTIHRQNIRLQNLIDQVVNNSLGYTEIDLKKENIRAKDYMHNILDDFLLSVGDKDVSVVRNVSLDSQRIEIDKFYFTTALFNILENAVKYEGDEVHVDASIGANGLFLVKIRDNGMGIPSRDQKHIFDKFYRVGNSTVHDVKGLGLGLYYTNQIVKAHNGQIKLKSTEGKGTLFSIEVPI